MNIINQFAEKINGVLQTFDRMMINGYILQLCNYRQFQYYLIEKKVLLKDFNEFAVEQTKLMCEHIENYISDQDVKLRYLPSGKIDKGELANEAYNEAPAKTGLIAAYSAVEICNTMTVKANAEKKLEIVSKGTKCKHYYLYHNDAEFGRMFIKIQTWFPYNVQIYINGREYLSKILDKNDIKYEMYNNSFSYIEYFAKAQELADGILNKKISDSFDGMIRKVNNLLPGIENIFNHGYYWCIDQCEFATDINFKSREDLSRIYKPLVENAYFTFSSTDIYSFFGRNLNKIHTFTKGEIVSDLRHRYQGYRIKFKINSNQIKMYDKGNNLRIEVTINNPKDFKIFKSTVTDPENKKWVPMGKSIANLYRYVEISRSITDRYLNALPEADTNKVPLKELESISSPKEVNGRKFSAFNLLNFYTLLLFGAISSGDFLINGFSNKQLRQKIFPDNSDPKIINKTSRLLAKLRAHGIIKKVRKNNRYFLTHFGRRICNSILLYANKSIANTV